MHHRRRQRDRLVERPTAALLGATALVALTVGLVAPDAGAAVESIGVSPGSGPPGTRVTVSGSDCAPGLVGGTTSNHVALFSGTLQVQLTIPVTSSGSWSTSFAIPSNAPAGPVRIAPVCVSSGFSLTTVYTPGTFMVTAAPPATAPPTTTPTTSGTTGTTHTTSSTAKTGSKGGGGSASGSTLGGGAGATAAGSTSGRTGGSRAANGARGSDGVISAIGTVTGDDSGRAAGLRSPELASDSSSSPGGLSWWWWLVLAAVVALGIGAWLWARRRHRAALAPPAEESVAAPVDDDPEPDDWLEQTYVDDAPTTTR